MIEAITAPRITTTQDEELFYVSLTNQDGEEVCTSSYMRDKADRVVIIQLDTPVEHRGKGNATALLEAIQRQEGASPIRVISTSHALGFYRKLGYTEVSPFIFQNK